MRRDERIEALLREWAQWLVVGDGSGYPRTSMIHPEWTPPAKGGTPSIKVGGSGRGEMVHGLVGRLSVRLQDTLVLAYCTQLPVAEQAHRLGCQAETVAQRVREAHRQLLQLMDPANPEK